MGFLGKMRKSVKSPMFRIKRIRTNNDSKLDSSTCDFSEETSSCLGIDSIDSFERIHIDNDGEDSEIDTVREETQELLTPANCRSRRRHFSFDERPISLIQEDDDDEMRSQHFREIEDDLLDAPYVSRSSSDDSDDSDGTDRYRPLSVETDASHDSTNPNLEGPHSSTPSAPCRSHPPPNNRHHRRTNSDGKFMHIFHDELSTLYEEPVKSGEDADDDAADDDSLSASSMSDVESTSSGLRVATSRRKGRRGSTLDEYNIRARWEYALQVMVRMGQCEPSSFYNSIAQMMPMSSSLVSSGDMDVAEI